MIPLSADTTPEAEEVQIRLLRQVSPTRRFELVRSLSATTRQLAWDGIRRANPISSEAEIDLLFVRYHYGPALAEALAHYMADHTRPNRG